MHAWIRSIAAAIVLAALAPIAHAATLTKPPATRVEIVADTLHGVTVADPYRWLEDQESHATRDWIEAQNAYTRSVLDPVPGREPIRARLEQLLRTDNQSVPIERAGRYFFSRRRADQDLSVLYVRRGAGGQDEVLVDPHPLDPEHRVSVSLLDVSEDGTLIAFGVRQGGEDEVTITLLDVETRRELPDQLPRGRYFGVSIKPDKSGFYYARHGQEGSRVRYHALGTDPAMDPVLFGEGYGPGTIVAPSLAEDGRHLMITVSHGSAGEKTEIYVQDLARGGSIAPVVNDLDAHFVGNVVDDRLFLRTNWNAPNYRILAVDLKDPARDRWHEIVPASEAVITSFTLAGGKLFVNDLENVVSTVRVFDPDGALQSKIVFPVLGSVGSVLGRWQGNEGFFSFTSFHIPTTIYRYDVAHGTKSEWWHSQVPVATESFEIQQVWYASKDGTRIPMFLVHKKGMRLDGTNPTLLTGYGGFRVSRTPSFSAHAALWVERGGVFALPNLRGGGEFGEAWHQAGMLDRKQNVFDDFIAAAEWLIEKRYTRPEKLAISGGSNGGLLVGAALTQRPELFRSVVCSVPLLDMLRYHEFLVARFWVPEYGSAEDPGQFRFLRAYSPYHNVRKGTKYPSVLLVSGDADTRVAPLHARKMAALLQAATGSERPILLHYETKMGHVGAAKPVSRQIDDLALELQFLFWQLGLGAPAVASGEEARGR